MSKIDQPHADLAAALRETADFIDTLPAGVGRVGASASILELGPFVSLDFRDVDADAFRRIANVFSGQEWRPSGGRGAYACDPGLPAPIRFVNVYAPKPKPAPAVVDFAAIARELADEDDE